MPSDYEEAHRLFSYNEETGVLHHKTKHFRVSIGDPAGYKRPGSYIVITFKGRKISAHRIIWLMKTGNFPVLEVDHIDRCRTNNKWNNLRLASRTQQQGNTKKHITNTSGHRGVRKTGRLWQALLYTKSGQKYIGGFKTMDQAIDAYNQAAKQYFGEFYQP